MKLNVTMDNTLYERLKKYCEANGDTKSGFISGAIADKLNAYETLEILRSLSDTLQIVAKNNTIDEESAKQINALESALHLMTNR